MRSLFPQPGNVYVGSRVIMAGALALWLPISDDYVSSPSQLLIGILLFAAAAVLFYIIRRQRARISEHLYAMSVVLDVLFVTYLIAHTGGPHSPFFLFYYLVSMFASYYFTWRNSLATAGLISSAYISTNFEIVQIIPLIELLLRLGFVWIFPFAVGYAASYIRRSEQRLFRLLDSLNESTTELERFQRRIETIYEASRALGALLNQREISNEVLSIVENVLGYETCSIKLLDRKQQKLREIARIQMGKRLFANLPQNVAVTGLLAGAIENIKTLRIGELDDANSYAPLTLGTQSLLVVPLVSQGEAIGLLVAESLAADHFSDSDEKVFSVLAAEAAMAYENARLHEELEKLAVTDELTGIYNYRFFNERLCEEKRRARRYRQPLSLLMVDIDWFKQYNDNYGHQAGNAVLKGVADMIRASIRDTDILCRYGGEEFVVILPQTEAAEARRVAERVRANIEKSAFGLAPDEPVVSLTVSVGITTYPDNGESPERLVQIVDQAMYRAKEMGRNKVAVL
jgi:diguanylate cyclase (GGDEF)-like protein